MDNIIQPTKIEVDWAGNYLNLRKTIEDGRSEQYAVSLEYSLTPCCDPRETALYNQIFAPYDMTDTVLVVEGKQVHVNKTFLSIHSDYFELFSKNFKEGNQNSEIEIPEVSYNDFGLMCSSFYPNRQFPNGKYLVNLFTKKRKHSDKTAERLLMNARRFLLSSVTLSVEHHLLHHSRIAAERILWLADERTIPKFLENCIREIDSLMKVKKLERSKENETLSDETKLLLFERILKLI